MITLDTFKKMMKGCEGRLPLLILDEFFEGNTSEDSIAPNQWEEGRLPIAEMWEALKKTEVMPNTAWVRVGLHDDTEIEKHNGEEILTLYESYSVPLPDLGKLKNW